MKFDEVEKKTHAFWRGVFLIRDFEKKELLYVALQVE